MLLGSELCPEKLSVLVMSVCNARKKASTRLLACSNEERECFDSERTTFNAWYRMFVKSTLFPQCYAALLWYLNYRLPLGQPTNKTSPNLSNR